MFNKESKLTKWSLIILFALLTAYFSTGARALETEQVVSGAYAPGALLEMKS